MKMKKLIAAALSFVMMLGINTAPAFAATSKSASTAITAEVGSGYTVTVPEKIALTSTTTGTGTYTGTIAVNIKGDVAANQTVTVAATAPTMKDAAGNSVAATFTSTPKTKGHGLTCRAMAPRVTMLFLHPSPPGSWTGTATFTCTLA